MRLPKSSLRISAPWLGGMGILTFVAGCGGQSDFADVTQAEEDSGAVAAPQDEPGTTPEDAGVPPAAPGTGNEPGTQGGFLAGGQAAGGTPAGGTAAGGFLAGGFIGGGTAEI